MNDDFYFGCWGNRTGHDLYDITGTRVRREFGYPARLEGVDLDGGFTVKMTDQGEANVRHLGGWTILSFWDNSVDTRPGSHSTFLSRGTWTFDEMVTRTKVAFPSVWNRFTFEVR